MGVCYNRLWKMLIDKKMNKADLARATKVTAATLSKMSKDKPVSIEVLMRICAYLRCDIGDVMEIILPEVSEKDTSTND